MGAEGKGRHSHAAGCTGGGGERRARPRHRAPETRAGSWTSFIEATLVEKGRKEEKIEEKLEINNQNGKYQAFKE